MCRAGPARNTSNYSAPNLSNRMSQSKNATTPLMRRPLNCLVMHLSLTQELEESRTTRSNSQGTGKRSWGPQNVVQKKNKIKICTCQHYLHDAKVCFVKSSSPTELRCFFSWRVGTEWMFEQGKLETNCFPAAHGNFLSPGPIQAGERGCLDLTKRQLACGGT